MKALTSTCPPVSFPCSSISLRQGQVVSRAEIEAHLYDEHAELMSNVIDAAVYSLRKKIDVRGKPSLIQTRRGMGYILESTQAQDV